MIIIKETNSHKIVSKMPISGSVLVNIISYGLRT